MGHSFLEKHGYKMADRIQADAYFRWSGHLARATHRQVGQILRFRDTFWWRYQFQKVKE